MPVLLNEVELGKMYRLPLESCFSLGASLVPNTLYTWKLEPLFSPIDEKIISYK